METAIDKPKQGEQLTNAKRLVAISKLIDCLSQSYYNTNELAKKTGLSRGVVETYRPIADEVISKSILDRNNIRNLQVRRYYTMIENLIKELKNCKTIKEKMSVYNTIAKFSGLLQLATGLNVETHVNVDYQQLVIVRSNGKKSSIKNEAGDQLTPDNIIDIKPK